MGPLDLVVAHGQGLGVGGPGEVDLAGSTSQFASHRGQSMVAGQGTVEPVEEGETGVGPVNLGNGHRAVEGDDR